MHGRRPRRQPGEERGRERCAPRIRPIHIIHRPHLLSRRLSYFALKMLTRLPRVDFQSCAHLISFFAAFILLSTSM